MSVKVNWHESFPHGYKTIMITFAFKIIIIVMLMHAIKIKIEMLLRMVIQALL